MCIPQASRNIGRRQEKQSAHTEEHGGDEYLASEARETQRQQNNIQLKIEKESLSAKNSTSRKIFYKK